MSEHLGIALTPFLPPSALWALGALAFALTLYAFLRGARGVLLRGIAFILILLALANPSLIEEQRAPLKDTALLLVDDSASMKIGDRAAQAASALDGLTKKLAAFPDLDTEIVHVGGTTETDLFHAIDAKLGALPRERLAGIIAVTDGEVHDDPAAKLSAPFHVLLAGHRDEIDLRLIVKEAPAYGIVGKSAALVLRIEDAPKAQGETATITFRRDDGTQSSFSMPVGKDMKFEIPIARAGRNLFAFSTDPLPGELTPINNSAAVTVNGIRDRLRVLLVSGEPHIGGRTWRNLLKSDPAVDLIHFTILRSPDKLDAIPNAELSLIAFPVHELFETQLRSFDLVIFDRFRQKSLIPDEYLANIANYVEAGGALLVSNATDQSLPPLTLSPLARILPAQPTGKLLTGAFVPDISETGKRHPVTDTLANVAPREKWGPWFRQVEASAQGDVLMTGANGAPLLVLSHAGKGRVAQFLSDQFWLWARNYKGGGPEAELLRRTAHWLVGEPELDETALDAQAAPAEDGGWQIVVTKRSLHEDGAMVDITGPDGGVSTVALATGKQPGILEGLYHANDVGLYRLKSGDDEMLVMAGPADAPEFGAMISTDEKLKPYAEASGGGIFRLEDGLLEIRRTNAGEAQHGGSWLGLKRNGQYRVAGSRAFPLWPAWLAVIVLLGSLMLGWRREGKSKS